MARISFNRMVFVVEPEINRFPAYRKCRPPWPHDLAKRRCSARDVMSTTLKFLTTKSEMKNILAQFGAVHTSCVECVELRMSATSHSLVGSKLSNWIEVMKI